MLLQVWLTLGCIWAGVMVAWSLPTPRAKPIDALIKDAMPSNSPAGQKIRADHGLKLIEYDMMLTKAQWEAIHGDKKKRKTGRIAISDEYYRWPGGIIPYEFTTDFSEDDKYYIRLGMDEWERFTCVSFVERTDEVDYVTFSSQDGCWSQVGKPGGQQFTSLEIPSCLDHHTIVHELGHIIGRHHEQTRPDRDDYITVLEENIEPDDLYNFDKYDWTFVSDYGVLYDYRSIMHYSQYAWSSNGQITIKTTDPDYQNLIGTVPGLSLKDVHLANLMYKCSDSCDMTTCPPEGILSEDCKCWCSTGIPGNPVVEWDGSSECVGDEDLEACMDYHENCPVWGSEGECEANPAYMLVNCRKTCKVCGPDALCLDLNGLCEYWSLIGSCETNTGWMFQNCMKSCKACDDDGPEYGPCEDVSTQCPSAAAEGACEEFPDSMLVRCPASCHACQSDPDYVCRNWHIRCNAWEEFGRCTSEPDYMRRQCPRACKLCSGGTFPDCKNYYWDDDMCDMWAESGECVTNEGWMLFNCALSCRVCGDDAVCLDRSPRCEEWRQDDYCTDEETRVDMSFYCPVSCDKCTSTSGDTYVCGNYDPNCESWEDEGWCDSDSNLMLPNCPRACNICGPDPVCKDFNADCSYWAGLGDCDSDQYGVWMKLHCALSCDTCPQPDLCNPNPCNGGKCTETGGSITCSECPTGFGGDRCQDDLCSPNPCQNEGECVGTDGGFSCKCKNGYSGDTCQMDLCSPNPCQNEGECKGTDGGFSCKCKNGYSGDTCQTVSECSNAISDGFCDYFNKLRMCELNHRWMLPRCPLTCKICGPDADCKDFDDDCELMAESGGCEGDPGFMLLHCRKACDMCDGGDIPNPAEPSSVCNHYRPEWCRRYLPDCPARASRGECRSNPHLLLYKCPIDCGICGSNARCEDYNPFCHWWARHGQCKTSRAFMEIICRDSCNCCG